MADARESSRLLIDEKPLQVLPGLAKEIGLNEAIFLQQVHYWLKSSKNIREGRNWIYNTYQQWAEQFPFWSKPTLIRTVYNLEKMGLLISNNFNQSPADHTKWYTIDYQVLSQIDKGLTHNDQASTHSNGLDQFDQGNTQIDNPPDVIKMSKPLDQFDQITPEITTETNHENNHREGGEGPVKPKKKSTTNGASAAPPLSGEKEKSKEIIPKTKTIKPISPVPKPEPKELMDNPAVIAFIEMFKLTPKVEQRRLIAENCPNLIAWNKTINAWQINGGNPTNLAGMLDKYAKEVEYLRNKAPPMSYRGNPGAQQYLESQERVQSAWDRMERERAERKAERDAHFAKLAEEDAETGAESQKDLSEKGT